MIDDIDQSTSTLRQLASRSIKELETKNLSSTEAPWILRSRTELNQGDIPAGFLLVVFDASKMKDIDGLYERFSEAFKFPEYFGRNLNSLDECLNDLDWLPAPGYVVTIRNHNSLLRDEHPEVRASLLEILENAGEEWARPQETGDPLGRDSRPFHTVLIGGES